jgi:hypothetical protein
VVSASVSFFLGYHADMEVYAQDHDLPGACGACPHVRDRRRRGPCTAFTAHTCTHRFDHAERSKVGAREGRESVIDR